LDEVVEEAIPVGNLGDMVVGNLGDMVGQLNPSVSGWLGGDGVFSGAGAARGAGAAEGGWIDELGGGADAIGELAPIALLYSRPPALGDSKLVACEKHSLDMSCPSGENIHVVMAAYGRRNNKICPTSTYKKQASLCLATNSLKVVADRCNDREKCSIDASNAMFGDPCYGVEKYLEVMYTCHKKKTLATRLDSGGTEEKVEGNYEQTSPRSSNEWHFVKITAKPGLDKVFVWKNKAGVEWELTLIKVEKNGNVLVFQVGEDCPYVQDGYKQARLFVKGDKIEIEGPGGIYTKRN